jgi:glyoxylase-like metal-dependent hydrolase (beta-lactamase superfamily II)
VSDRPAGLPAGIRRLTVPTPFAVGPVNAYLIDGPPLTLVDGGPNLASSLTELERLLRDAGRRVEELELLVVTHHHMDHVGLTGAIAERSGAEVAFLGAARRLVEDYAAEAERDDAFAAALMRRHGVEASVVKALEATAARMRWFGAPAAVDRPLADGATLEIGERRLRVLHRPGHSVADVVLHDADAKLLIAGDHLLGRISSNALVARALDQPAGGPERARPLLDYRRSLQATRELDVDLVLGGHGPAFGDHRALIDRRLADQERRATRILAMLRDGPASAHAIAASIWGEVAITQAYLTLSEVLGHLDLLEDEGLVRETAGDGVGLFEHVGRGG